MSEGSERAERRWLAAASALTLLLTSLPCLIGLALSRPEHPFTGVLLGVEDLYSYYAKMRVGAGGALLFQNAYAVEPHSGALGYSFYLLLGRLAAGGMGSRVPIGRLIAVYHTARALLGIPLLALLYRVAALFVEDVRQRRLAWLLAVWGGGLGWLALLISGDVLAFGGLLDLYVGEVSTYLPLLALPHLLLARAALLGGLLCLVRAVESGAWRWALGAGLCWLLMAAVIPFYIGAAGGIVGGWLIARAALARRMDWRIVTRGLAAGLPGAALVLASYALIAGDPVYASWLAQNRLPLPSLPAFASTFGVAIALAAFGARAALRARLPRTDLLVGWALASPLLMLAPVPFRLRLIEGFFIPLSVLAAVGFASIVRAWAPAARRAALAALLMLALPSGLLLLFGASALALTPAPPAYADPALLPSLDWLRAQAPAGAVVLAPQEAGVMLPAYAPVRVVIGHGFETPFYAEKEAAAAAFFGGELDAAQQRALLDRYGVDYIYSQGEQAAAFLTAGGPFEAAFSSPGATIYRVARPEGSPAGSPAGG
jgi:hypothetical protein